MNREQNMDMASTLMTKALSLPRDEEDHLYHLLMAMTWFIANPYDYTEEELVEEIERFRIAAKDL